MTRIFLIIVGNVAISLVSRHFGQPIWVGVMVGVLWSALMIALVKDRP